ncbi:MAG TPA: hypothetical protein VNQ79_19480 [Blastocatellia bacterium]|nr:hypothetical protein [Blastocatellia bacterium]
MISLKPVTKSVLLIMALISVALSLSAQTKGARKAEPAAAKPTPTSDIKIRTRSSVGGNAFESTVYIKGARERNEMAGGAGFVTISQCDLKRTIQLNDPMKTYLIQPWATDTAAETPAKTTDEKAKPEPKDARRGGVIYVTQTMTDTGERRDFFGYKARHIKTTMTMEPSPEACNQAKTRMETDGWYIDLEYGMECRNENRVTQGYGGGRAGCQDQMRFKNSGAARLGYPVDVTTTIYDESGRKTEMRTEVVELSRATLDAALFEVPAGYTEAQDYQQLAGISPKQMMAQAMKGDTSHSDNSSVPEALKNSQAATPKTVTGPKKAGVIRVGVVLPKTQMGQGSAGDGFAEPIRNLLVQYLSGPAIEIAALEARIPAQIELEAKQKECGFVLYSSVTQKQGGGGFGSMLRKAGPLSNIASVAGYGSGAGAVAGAVATTAIVTAADIAVGIKAKDEITLDYKVTAVGSDAPVASNTLRAKAKTDREDILSPLLEQAATAVISAVVKR